ncbi:LysR family transcriptional regulator [Actinoplanes sp. NEAU-A12]|uniref:LysR family transcriptional regulator n=1 Tax=Actinoplanes sandaracinus TaxID=3045177 RepID=A0ABT6WHE3_9ACTN|nr:LysR family transcriptional regulator [Actinoplanes sandaracinus]MDI6099146.1 LysR family transcriptional regulator [Actinoplanes sandaracinus]
MNQRELEAFVTVAKFGRMDLAARALGYSQPAISYQIQCLEQALGVKLFVRNSTGTAITASGAIMLPSVKAVLALMNGIKHTVSQRPAHSTAVPAGRLPQ